MLVYFEGIDGVGKSTQISLFNDLECVKTCEPGGTKLGKSLRELIFNAHPSSRAEIFLFLADRAEHYEKIIKVNKHKLILSDRSFVSGLAYAMLLLPATLISTPPKPLASNNPKGIAPNKYAIKYKRIFSFIYALLCLKYDERAF